MTSLVVNIEFPRKFEASVMPTHRLKRRQELFVPGR
jgi:hypothetical protein